MVNNTNPGYTRLLTKPPR